MHLSLSGLAVFNVVWLLLLFWLTTVMLFGSCERPTFSCRGTDPGSVTEFLETHAGITEHIWTGWGRVAGFRAWILHTDTSLLSLTLNIKESSCAWRPRLWQHPRASHFFTDLVSEPTGQASAIFQRERFAVHSDGGVRVRGCGASQSQVRRWPGAWWSSAAARWNPPQPWRVFVVVSCLAHRVRTLSYT